MLLRGARNAVFIIKKSASEPNTLYVSGINEIGKNTGGLNTHSGIKIAQYSINGNDAAKAYCALPKNISGDPQLATSLPNLTDGTCRLIAIIAMACANS